MSSLIATIQNNYGSYTDTEKKIAEALLHEPNKIKQLTIQELAAYWNVSTATITRFCKKNGYSGFMEFRLALPQEKNGEAKSNSITDAVTAYYEKNIRHSIELLELAKIQQVSADIKNCKTVYLWGLGSSGRTASEFEQTLTRMGLSVKSITDPHMLLLTLSQIKKNDLVITISISGRSKELLGALELLKKRCTVVVLTSDPNSPVAKASDYFLQVSDIKVNNLYVMNFQLSLIFLLDCITESLLADDELRKHFHDTFDLLRKYHEIID